MSAMRHDAHIMVQQRLKQALGHIGAVIDMTEAGRSCSDIAQQLEAVESTIRGAKRLLVQNHLKQCITDALCEGKMSREDAMAQFTDLTKYF